MQEYCHPFDDQVKRTYHLCALSKEDKFVLIDYWAKYGIICIVASPSALASEEVWFCRLILLPVVAALLALYKRYIMPPETSVTNSTPASSFALATTALSHRLSMPWLQIVTFLYCRCIPWKKPTHSSTVLLGYF